MEVKLKHILEGRFYEEALLEGEVAEILHDVWKKSGLRQKEIALKLGVTAPRVSQVLAGQNLTLESLAAYGWAMGVRFNITVEEI